MEEAACNACGDRQSERLFTALDYLTGDRFVVVRCRRCGLAFVNPRPLTRELARYYPPLYYGPRRSLFDRVTTTARTRRVERLHGGKPGAVLDVGCGQGAMLARLRERGWRVLGTEYGERPPVTTPGIDIRYAPLEECGLPPESFDVITMWHVLEHLPDPQATLAEAHRLLRPGGVLLIAVPNFGSLQARLTGPYWFHLDVPRHLFQFRSRDLVTLLERVGLSVGRTRRFSFEYDTFGFVQSMLNRALPRPNLLFDFLAHGGSRTPSAPAGTAVSLAMAPFLMVAACVFCPLESALGFGGTVEVVARKGAPA